MANQVQKTARLEALAARLGSYHTIPRESLVKDCTEEWAIKYGALSCIQLSLDIICDIISRRNFGLPHSYREAVKLIETKGYIDDELSGFLTDCIAVREHLLHGEPEDSSSEVFTVLINSHLFRKFSDSVNALER